MAEYDYAEEANRVAFRDVRIGHKVINRGKCKAGVRRSFIWQADRLTEAEVYSSLLPSTLRGSAPVINLDDPIAGHYMYHREGVLFDSYLGVGQRLIDESHPRLVSLTRRLIRSRALFRREAATNDFLVSHPNDGLATPQKLSDLVRGLAGKAFPAKAPYRCFFSSSGSEAIEAAIKVACRQCHHRLLLRYGHDVEKKLMGVLGIQEIALSHPVDKEPVYADYPFYFVVPRNSFHGRTLGALALTDVRPVQKRGFPTGVRAVRIPFNRDPEQIEALLVDEKLDDILSKEETLMEILASGRVPVELVAGVVLEAFQGEGGYEKSEPGWINSIVSACRRRGITVIVDEVQTFARTGRVFASEHYDIDPDIIAIGKPSVVGVTLASNGVSESQPLGWHSNTWGGGRIFEINFGYEVIHAFVNFPEPHFLGLTYLENSVVKGLYVHAKLERLLDKYPTHFIDFSGCGCFWRLLVRERERFCEVARRHGLKVLTVGVTDEVSAVRGLFLADVLTKEIDCYMQLLDDIFKELSS
jgi:4-aminobutyrate aminotransferase-like enzyme